MRIQTRLGIIAATIITVILSVSGVILRSAMIDAAIDEAILTSEAVVGAAETTQAQLSRLHGADALDLKELIEREKDAMMSAQGGYRSTMAFKSIPVITGIETAKGTAKKSGVGFTVVATNARNPGFDVGVDADRTDFRRKLLKEATEKANDAEESHVWRIDEASDDLVYMHAIKLTSDCMLCHGDPANSTTGDGKDPLGFPMENWRVGDVHGAYEVRTPLGPVRASAMSVVGKVAFWGVLVGIGGVAALFYLMRQTVIRPLNRTISALEGMADGDGNLRFRLPAESKDELGHLSKCVNRFIEKVQEIVRSISEHSTLVRSAADRLRSNADALREGAGRTGAESAQVAAAAEELSVGITQVGSSGEMMSQSLTSVASAVEEMTASISEVATGAEDAAKIAATAERITIESRDRIAALGSAADEIGRVVETIQDIADQTNLLALNATIEAARAGESGKGFGVVADEVKTLARQTAEATTDIRGRIERIQSAATDSVKSIEEIDGVIAKVSERSKIIADAVSQQRLATQEIARTLSENSSTVDAVARSVVESSKASQEITKSVAKVDTLARDAAREADASKMSVNDLHKLAESLQAQISRFIV